VLNFPTIPQYRLGAKAFRSEMPEHLDFSPMFETNPVLISPAENQCGIPSKPALRHVAHLPFVSFPVGASIEKSVNRQFASQGLSTNTVLLLTHFERVK